MSVEENMFQAALQAIEKGEKARARDLLTRLLRSHSNNPQYWLWMSSVVETRRERLHCLKQVLQLDPNNLLARRGLILMDALLPDPGQAIPLQYQRRNWTLPPLVGEQRPGLFTPGSWRQMGLLIGAILLLAGLVTAGVLGILSLRPKQQALVYSTYTPTATETASPTSRVRSPTPTPGVTPLWAYLKETYTPTPIYVRTPHPITEAYALALQRFGSGNYDEMLTYLQQAIRLDPDSPDLYYYMGEAYRLKKNYNQASKQYDQALAKQRNFAPAYLGKARLTLASSAARWREALTSLQKAVELDPNFAEAYLEMAVLYLDQKNSPAALQALEAVANLTPDSTLLYYYRARAYLMEGNFELALQNASQANQRDLTFLDGYRLLAEVFILSGKPGRAQEALETYTRYRTRDAQALAWLGAAYAANQERQKALETFEKALKLDSRLADVYLQRGLMYLASNDLNLAEEDLIQAVRLDSRSFLAHLTLGQVYFGQERYRNAYQEFSLAEAYQGSEAERAQIYYWRAQTSEKLDEINAAVKDWKALLALPPESYPAAWAEKANKQLGVLSTPTATPITPTLTMTRQPSRTFTPTFTRQPSRTVSPTPTPRPTFTLTSTRTPRPTFTATPTATSRP